MWGRILLLKGVSCCNDDRRSNKEDHISVLNPDEGGEKWIVLGRGGAMTALGVGGVISEWVGKVEGPGIGRENEGL